MITDIKVWPITTQDDMDHIQEAANEDGGRSLIGPTHLVTKAGSPIGAFSVESPTVYWWMHSKKATPKDSRAVFQALDAIMMDRRQEHYIIPCEESSPYYGLLEKHCSVIRPIEGRDWTLFTNKH